MHYLIVWNIRNRNITTRAMVIKLSFKAVPPLSNILPVRIVSFAWFECCQGLGLLSTVMFVKLELVHLIFYCYPMAVQICEMDPGFFRDFDAMVRNLQGRLEILAISVHAEGDTNVDHYDDHEEPPSNLPKASTASDIQLSEKLQKQTISEKKADVVGDVKQQSKCSTCNAYVGDTKQYREHFKSEWHKHNLRRKTKQLPPLSAEECMGDMEISDSRADLKDYSF